MNMLPTQLRIPHGDLKVYLQVHMVKCHYLYTTFEYFKVELKGNY